MAEGKLRVLSITTHPVQYMAPLLRRMAKHPRLDLRVAYCSLRGAEGGHDPEFGTQVKWDVPLLDGYEWTHVPNRGSGDDSFWGLNNPGLRELIRAGKFDAVLCYTGYLRASFWIARSAAKKEKAAFIFGTDTATLEARDGKSWKKWIKKIVWPRVFRLADQVIVPSTGSREMMRSLGIPETRITLTPPCVDNDWWVEQAAGVNRDAERRKLGIRDDETAVLFCAKLQPWKRPMDLLHAFVAAHIAKSKLIFAGDGPQRADLEAETIRLGIADRVKFLGFVNQSSLPALYKLVDLMVLPSSYEPFAMVVNEAMWCGCPVMASNQVGAARDLIMPIAPEFVFPVGDLAALAKKLSDAAADRAGLDRVRESALAHIQGWSLDSNTEALIQAIEAATARVRGS